MRLSSPSFYSNSVDKCSISVQWEQKTRLFSRVVARERSHVTQPSMRLCVLLNVLSARERVAQRYRNIHVSSRMYVLLTFYVLFVHLCSVVSWTFAGSLDLLHLQFSACLSVSFRSMGLKSCASSCDGNCCIRCLLVETGENNIAYLYFDRAVCKRWSHWQVFHVFDGEPWSCSETNDCLPYTTDLNILDYNVRNTFFSRTMVFVSRQHPVCPFE